MDVDGVLAVGGLVTVVGVARADGVIVVADGAAAVVDVVGVVGGVRVAVVSWATPLPRRGS